MNNDETTGRRPDKTSYLGPSKGCPGCGAMAITDTALAQRGPVIMAGPVRKWEAIDTAVKAVELNVFIGYVRESGLEMPRACWPGARLRIGWFRHCHVDGRHLHERCKACKYEWTSTFAAESGPGEQP